ncbi:MAG TPA: hypothetical protein VGN83_09005 [Falsiroseomonas sp.]|jgi:hypothetical protein|nr:hypothetical protein [Falsiroseomonas sp.]
MRAIWVWRLMLMVAVPSLALLALSLSTNLPPVLADPDHRDRANLLGWAMALAAGILAVLASIMLRRRGRIGAAIVLAAVVALPALLGIGIAAFIVLLFILQG